MLHPIFSTLIQRPDLVIDHLSAYAALFQVEASHAGSNIIARAVCGLVAVLAGFVFLGLAGTALMLGLVLNQFHWVLLAVPGLALVLLIIAVIKAKKPLPREHFSEVKAQIQSDAQALRMVG